MELRGGRRPEVWFAEVAEADLDAELHYLAQDSYGYDPDPKRITILERFSKQA